MDGDIQWSMRIPAPAVRRLPSRRARRDVIPANRVDRYKLLHVRQLRISIRSMANFILRWSMGRRQT
jgi:hypothetical protein